LRSSFAKITVVVLIGASVAVLTYWLLIAQTQPIAPFDYVSLLTGLAGFVFGLYQVVEENNAKQSQKTLLLALWNSSKANIARMQQVAIQQDPTKSLPQALVGVLQQEQIHLEGLLQANHQTDLGNSPSPSHQQAISTIELIEGRDEVRAALTTFTRSAQDFIYIVGGRSRDRAYLDCLLERIKRGDIEYTRIVTGDHIREPLFDHLAELGKISNLEESNIRIGYLEEDKYGSFTVTRDGVFWALPSSTQTQLTAGVVIRSPKVASDFRAHVISLLNGEKQQKGLEFFRSICKEFLVASAAPASGNP
jgi:hypothetical protein